MLARAHPMSHHPMAASWPAFDGASPAPTQQLALFDPASGPASTGLAGTERTSTDALWSEAEVVRLHWGLLEELRKLPDPDAPLDEKIETLNWVFTEADKDARPFSFVSCLKVVGCSPLSPVDGYFGLVDHEAVRDWIAANVSRWMRATLDRYPPWVRELIRSDPQHVANELLRDPQWLNEEVKRRGGPDLLDPGDHFGTLPFAGGTPHEQARTEACHG